MMFKKEVEQVKNGLDNSTEKIKKEIKHTSTSLMLGFSLIFGFAAGSISTAIVYSVVKRNS